MGCASGPLYSAKRGVKSWARRLRYRLEMPIRDGHGDLGSKLNMIRGTMTGAIWSVIGNEIPDRVASRGHTQKSLRLAWSIRLFFEMFPHSSEHSHFSEKTCFFSMFFSTLWSQQHESNLESFAKRHRHVRRTTPSSCGPCCALQCLLPCSIAAVGTPEARSPQNMSSCREK